LWDRLFGTAWLPARNEWPATGLAEIDQPRSLWGWIDLPVRFGRSRRDAPVESALELR